MDKNQIIENIKRSKSFLCVGLDPIDETIFASYVSDKPRPPYISVARINEELPDDMLTKVFLFNREIIDATAHFCIAYKPNVAFYERWGALGWNTLRETLAYIKSNYPDKLVIADGKRGDIGNTSSEYEKTFFEEMDFDALTVAPYMGEDSVTPFLKRDGKWVVLLALTSNNGSQDFQMMEDKNGERLFERVIRISQTWAGDDKMMYVVGATQGKLIEDVRRIAPKNFLLVPGVGAQGGSLEEVCRYGMTDECGLIVNVSRAIIYADKTNRFAEKAGEAARAIQQQMEALLVQKGII